MNRNERDFLIGFSRAALLTQRVQDCCPSHTTPREYMEDVAHLHAASADYVGRGLAAGCLSAVGKK